MENVKNLIREVKNLPDIKKGINLRPVKIAIINLLKEYDDK